VVTHTAKRAGDGGHRHHKGETRVPALLLVLLIVIALFIVGFAVVKFLIWVAIVLAIIWVIGFFVRGIEGGGRRRWYRW
jgi:membrane protein YdbS with pleckstrin-like domain